VPKDSISSVIPSVLAIHHPAPPTALLATPLISKSTANITTVTTAVSRSPHRHKLTLPWLPFSIHEAWLCAFCPHGGGRDFGPVILTQDGTDYEPDFLKQATGLRLEAAMDFFSL